MILATNKCGCPPKKEKPPCSPCCASKNVSIKSAPKKCPPPAPRIVDPSTCCPVKPSETKYQRSSKIRSEIAEKGLPYKEIEAIINNNRVVIRTQTEPGRVEYDPPCDCVEDPLPSRRVEAEESQVQDSGNRTVMLYPRPREQDRKSTDFQYHHGDEGFKLRNTIDQAENPNIFLLKFKRKSSAGDKKFNIDLEFKTPRPWSTKKLLEYSQQIKPPESSTATLKKDVEEERKNKEVSSQSKKGKRQ
ncbi:uncharacterized protein LOC114876781 [Osmia bicornis bicornis]|uniref:uncharacterized protein LOC114876781 n=1 Tax=Osmia bicornis bicornis TaxID=1437191 RepID=UPI001EAEE3DB|nr:uncharacterized protein LOC114876781 [Osmia bicornis bicornis]